MKDVTLRQLEYFVAVAEEQSITRAALKCHVTQAAISQALKELETLLGVQLLIRRTSKGISLTPAGRMVATRGRTLLGEVRHLVSAADGAVESGTFSIGCFPSLSPLVMPEIAEFFADRYPGVRLEIIEESAPEIQERMMRGQVDVCFIYEAQRHPEASPRLLRERRYRVALAADHPLAAQDAVSVRDLAPYPCAVLNLAPASYLNEAMLRRFGLVPDVVYRSSNVETIRAIVGRGLAWALLMHEVEASGEGRPLRFLPVVEELGTNSLLAVLPRGVRPSSLTSALISHCRAALAP